MSIISSRKHYYQTVQKVSRRVEKLQSKRRVESYVFDGMPVQTVASGCRSMNAAGFLFILWYSYLSSRCCYSLSLSIYLSVCPPYPRCVWGARVWVIIWKAASCPFILRQHSNFGSWSWSLKTLAAVAGCSSCFFAREMHTILPSPKIKVKGGHWAALWRKHIVIEEAKVIG